MCMTEGLGFGNRRQIGVHLDGLKSVGVDRLEVIEGPSGRRRPTKAERP
jgi:transposase